MSFRSRLFATLLLSALLPLIALSFIIRGEMLSRFSAQYDEQEKALVAVIEGDLSQTRTAIKAAMTMLAASLEKDNAFRRAVVDRARSDREYLLDYASGAMQLAGLSMLQIQDASGRIISSGHFRNEFDRLDGGVPERLIAIDDRTALVKARSPEGPFLALTSTTDFQVAGSAFSLVGGVRVDQHFLARLERGFTMRVDLVFPGGSLSARTGSGAAPTTTGAETPGVADTTSALQHGRIAESVSIPFIDSNSPEQQTAVFLVVHPRNDLEELRDDIDRWFLIVVGLASILAIFMISRLSVRMSRPITELARKTERIDLDRLNVRFGTNRNDEIGTLSRVMASMVGRIKSSAIRIREAERAATRGELARQVNHDIKNGLTPIRNVFSHLEDVSSGDPEEFRKVFDERKSTLKSSISYLADLATNYARLSPRSVSTRCDVNAIVSRAVQDLQVEGRINLSCGEPVFLTADPVSIRRIVENLVTNALESMESASGSVTVSTRQIDSGENDPFLQITIADDGPGISVEEQKNIFNDFYTTKEKGTGLGLSIARRLVMDMNGSIRYEDGPQGGSCFVIHLPISFQPEA